MRGLTHCEKCGQALNYDEYVLCKYCEEDIKTNKEQIRQYFEDKAKEKQ